MHMTVADDARTRRLQHRAMQLSLWIGVAMFVGKVVAYVVTQSAAILSDAAESVVHVVAVGFAAYSLKLSHRPPDEDHPYGHEKISFFSAGFEGAMIGIAALYIFYEAVSKLLTGAVVEHLGHGALLITAATVVNAFLGLYLVRTGKREESLILVANGKHVLTDSITSLGVLVALGLIAITGWQPWDPLIAILLAAHILRSGVGLVRESVHGLMDRKDPDLDGALREILDTWSADTDMTYHGLRHRSGGNVLWVDVHLLFPGSVPVERAHAAATRLENALDGRFPNRRVEVTSHLEPLEQHAAHHPEGGHQHRR